MQQRLCFGFEDCPGEALVGFGSQQAQGSRSVAGEGLPHSTRNRGLQVVSRGFTCLKLHNGVLSSIRSQL